MSKHTPGPWVASHIGETGFSRSVPVYQVRSSDPQYTAIVDAAGEADARLIAAAPELLEVLKYVMTAHGEQLTDAFDKAWEVIAKAEGQAERSEGGSSP